MEDQSVVSSTAESKRTAVTQKILFGFSQLLPVALGMLLLKAPQIGIILAFLSALLTNYQWANEWRIHSSRRLSFIILWSVLDSAIYLISYFIYLDYSLTQAGWHSSWTIGVKLF